MLKLKLGELTVPGTVLAADASCALLALVWSAESGGEPLSDRAWATAALKVADSAARSAVVKVCEASAEDLASVAASRGLATFVLQTRPARTNPERETQ